MSIANDEEVRSGFGTGGSSTGPGVEAVTGGVFRTGAECIGRLVDSASAFSAFSHAWMMAFISAISSHTSMLLLETLESNDISSRSPKLKKKNIISH